MKKLLALLLSVTLLLSLTACGSKKTEEKKGEDKTADENKPTASTAELYEKAAALIEDGDYEEAYLLLKDVKDTKANEDLIALKNTLVWLPIEIVSSEPDDRLVCSYDDNGNLVKIVYTDSNGQQITRTGTYDANDNCLTYRITDEVQITYTYDANGNLIKEWNSGGRQFDYTYDADGNCLTQVESRFYPKNINNIYYRTETTYTYDANGNRLTAVNISPVTNGEVKTETTYTYDANGDCLTIAESSSDINGCFSKYETTYTYTYDTAGNLLVKEEIPTDAYNKRYKTTYTYDSKGNLATEEFVNNNDFQMKSWYKYAYAYDDNGNLLSVDYTTSTGENQNATYDDRTYDKYGNILTDGPYTASWKLCYYPNGMPEIAKTSLLCHVNAMLRLDEHTMWNTGTVLPDGGHLNLSGSINMSDGTIISGNISFNGEPVIIVKPENEN